MWTENRQNAQLQRDGYNSDPAAMNESGYSDAAMTDMSFDPTHDLPEWIDLPPEKVKQVLKHVNEYMDPIPFDPPPSTLGRVRMLPFYNDYYLLELVNLVTVPAYAKYAICKPGDVNVMDWTVDPIYDVNQKAPINITADNVIPYIKFFSDYVFTSDGQRKIIEMLDDIPWLETAKPYQKVRAQSFLQPARVTHEYDDGGYRVEVTDMALYNLYKSVIFVHSNGTIDWLIQDTLVEDMEIFRDNMLV